MVSELPRLPRLQASRPAEIYEVNIRYFSLRPPRAKRQHNQIARYPGRHNETALCPLQTTTVWAVGAHSKIALALPVLNVNRAIRSLKWQGKRLNCPVSLSLHVLGAVLGGCQSDESDNRICSQLECAKALLTLPCSPSCPPASGRGAHVRGSSRLASVFARAKIRCGKAEVVIPSLQQLGELIPSRIAVTVPSALDRWGRMGA